MTDEPESDAGSGFEEYDPAEKTVYSPFRRNTQAPAAKALWLIVSLGMVAFAIWRAGRGLTPTAEYDPTLDPVVGRHLLSLNLHPVDPGVPLQVADIKGRVVLLNYWGPWCFRCAEEMPHLAAIHQKLGAHHDFKLISVSCSQTGDDLSREHAQSTKQFLAKYGAKFPAYLDPEKSNRLSLVSIAEMGDFGYPMTILLDRKTAVRGIWPGYRNGDEKMMETMILKLLDEPIDR